QEFHASWQSSAQLVRISLKPLSPNSARRIVDTVAGHTMLPEETIMGVVHRTGGVPLFIEELTRAVLESGSVNHAEGPIPATLHDSLMVRLDRLGAAKEVLQIGAVIGSEFSFELLQAVHSGGDRELEQALHALTDSELLYVRGIAPDATYHFKHALI